MSSQNYIKAFFLYLFKFAVKYVKLLLIELGMTFASVCINSFYYEHQEHQFLKSADCNKCPTSLAGGITA